MSAFAACVEEAFIRTDFIARRIGGLANHDLRRSLELSQKVITAPVIKVDELVSAYFASSQVLIPERRIVQALLCGDYNRFKQEAHEYILNLFAIESGCMNTPLLRTSLLRLLIDKENAATDDLGAYMNYEELDHYFEGMGVDSRAVTAAIEEMVDYRLVEPYEPTTEKITPTTRLAIATSGHMHFEMCFNDPVYFQQMALTIFMRSPDIVRGLRTITNRKMSSADWTQVQRVFARYCLDEDQKLARVPLHPDFESQMRLRREFERWLN